MPAHIKWLDGKSHEKVVQRCLLWVVLIVLLICPLAGFTALALSTGCRRQFFSSISVLPFRAKEQVQITMTQENAKTSFLSPGTPTSP